MPYLTEQELGFYTTKILDAVAEIHDTGCLHNSLTPDNIYLHRNSMGADNKFSIRLSGFSQVSHIGTEAQKNG